jgi:hypothetical protein
MSINKTRKLLTPLRRDLMGTRSAVIAAVVCVCALSAVPIGAAESWYQAFTCIQGAFLKAREMSLRLDLLMASGGSSQSTTYPEALCRQRDLIECHAPAEGEPRGTGNAYAWPMTLTVEGQDVARLMPVVNWRRLPSVVQTLRFRASLGDVDVSHVIAEVPPTVLAFEFEDSTLVEHANGGGGASRDHEHRRDAPVESLTLARCVLTTSLLASGAWLAPLGVRRLTVEACRLSSAASAAAVAATLVAPLQHVEELRIVANRGRVALVPLLARIAPAAAAESLRLLEIDVRGSTADDDSDAAAFDEAEAARLLAPLAALRTLTLSHAPFRALPPVLPAALTSLALTFALLAGPFPDAVARFAALEELDLTGNDLAAVPYELPAALTRVRLAGNALSGALDVARLPRHLHEFNVSGNELRGPLDLTALPPQIEVFDVSYNALSGPVTLSRLPASLRHLLINDNELTGRYDVSRVPLLSVRIALGNNNWTSLMPRVRGARRSGADGVA